MAIERFEQLAVWQKSHAVVLDVYRLTAMLPSTEKFGLMSQMRRAAVSVPANIAEGFKRRGAKEKVRFYNIAQASLEELRYYFILCQDLNYLTIEPELVSNAHQINKMLHTLIRTISE
jgi:four helix bundle protein